MSGNNWKIISLFFFLAYVLFFASAPLNIALNFAHEDSFYYLKIAKNFSEGYFSTFDKVSRTNGYHPLYL
ncbi:MAG: hypothetical protein MUE56_04680, partial [Ignavibacteria bacterium]|nr:hypothetical protein [Ignavibacteria bacterium]